MDLSKRHRWDGNGPKTDGTIVEALYTAPAAAAAAPTVAATPVATAAAATTLSPPKSPARGSGAGGAVAESPSGLPRGGSDGESSGSGKGSGGGLLGLLTPALPKPPTVDELQINADEYALARTSPLATTNGSRWLHTMSAVFPTQWSSMRCA